MSEIDSRKRDGADGMVAFNFLIFARRFIDSHKITTFFLDKRRNR